MTVNLRLHATYLEYQLAHQVFPQEKCPVDDHQNELNDEHCDQHSGHFVLFEVRGD